MTAFACLSFLELLILLLIYLGFALGLGTVIAFAITRIFRSGGSR